MFDLSMHVLNDIMIGITYRYVYYDLEITIAYLSYVKFDYCAFDGQFTSLVQSLDKV